MRRYTLLNQFRSFYFNNFFDDMESQVEYFAVFGGFAWEVDTSKSIQELIEELVLENFDELNQKIEYLTMGDKNNKKLLSALAIGDRRIFSAFNRAGLNNGNGGAALNYLQEKGLLQIEYSRETSPKEFYPKLKLSREEARRRISHKVLFVKPFIRFWFYFIAPFVKDIKIGNFDKVLENFNNKQNSYTSLVFEELSEVLLNYNLRDVSILSSGSYWDANTEIDILTITQDDKFYIGECKWTNHKVNKKELHKLYAKCEKIDIEPTQIVLFSKRGFSKELMQLQSKELALYSVEDFKALLKNIKADDLINDCI